MAAITDAPHFRDPEKAREYLESLRWPDGPVCPHCGGIEKVYRLKGRGGKKGTSARPGLYKCGERECRKQFSVTVGTVFERSKIPLNTWLLATYYLCSSKKGMSSHQLHRMLGVTYKTAWFMAHRIREAMRVTEPEPPMGDDGGIVEIDETFWGGSRRKRLGQPTRRGNAHKMKVLTLVERNGRARSFHVARVNAATLKPIIRKNVARHATIMTDDSYAYDGLGLEFASHSVVRHTQREYARGTTHTQTIESFFSILKRGLTGVYHHVSEAHLGMYIGEFDFRYTRRHVTDAERTDDALRGIEGKRLTYRQPTGAWAEA